MGTRLLGPMNYSMYSKSLSLIWFNVNKSREIVDVFIEIQMQLHIWFCPIVTSLFPLLKSFPSNSMRENFGSVANSILQPLSSLSFRLRLLSTVGLWYSGVPENIFPTIDKPFSFLFGARIWKLGKKLKSQCSPGVGRSKSQWELSNFLHQILKNIAI